jgi:hypothetical protein
MKATLKRPIAFVKRNVMDGDIILLPVEVIDKPSAVSGCRHPRQIAAILDTFPDT